MEKHDTSIFKVSVFDQSLNKLYDVLEGIFNIKANTPGRGHESIVFKSLVKFQKFHKLYGNSQIKPLFKEVLDKNIDFILADNLSFLEIAPLITLTIKESKETKTPASLSLGKFYTLCLGFGKKASDLILPEFGSALYKIFYALSLEEIAAPGTEQADAIKKRQETLLKIVKSRTTKVTGPEDANNATASIITGLTRGLDLNKSVSGGGNIGEIVDKLTDNANEVLSQMNINMKIPPQIKKKITQTSTNLTKMMEKNPDPENIMKTAMEELKPKIVEDPEELKKYEPIVEKEDQK